MSKAPLEARFRRKEDSWSKEQYRLVQEIGSLKSVSRHANEQSVLYRDLKTKNEVIEGCKRKLIRLAWNIRVTNICISKYWHNSHLHYFPTHLHYLRNDVSPFLPVAVLEYLQREFAPPSKIHASPWSYSFAESCQHICLSSTTFVCIVARTFSTNQACNGTTKARVRTKYFSINNKSSYTLYFYSFLFCLSLNLSSLSLK